MEKEFSKEAHQPICCSPSLLLRHCVVKGQTLNKECTESDVWISCFSVRPLGMKVCAWLLEKGNVLEANQYSVFAVA